MTHSTFLKALLTYISGTFVGAVYFVVTFEANSPRISDLAHDRVLGLHVSEVIERFGPPHLNPRLGAYDDDFVVEYDDRSGRTFAARFENGCLVAASQLQR